MDLVYGSIDLVGFMFTAWSSRELVYLYQGM